VPALSAVGAILRHMNAGEPFIGSEALAAGTLASHQLRTRYQAVFPDVYVARGVRLCAQQRIIAAWLWSRRRATIAGLAASALHDAKWVEDDLTVELMHANPRGPRGIVTRRDVLLDGERQLLDGRAVTTPERTAFDIGRRGSLWGAVARLDALARATGVKASDVSALAGRHRGTRGLSQLETALDLMDAGAQSPRETRLRLVLIEAGFPRPQTQIPVAGPDGVPFAFLDMGWEEWMLAVEYDGDHHRVDRRQFASDIHRLEKISQAGWRVVRVVAEDSRTDIVGRVSRLVASSVH
jgi:hypothetical protein